MRVPQGIKNNESTESVKFSLGSSIANNRLQITNLAKTYKNGVNALKSISLTLSNGIFGLLGPNGAGKSSLMRSIATMQAFDSGTITFNGVDIQKNPNIIRNSLGYLPQEFGVYPKISAYKLLDYIAVLKGINNKAERHNQVEYLLELTNLTADKKLNVADYSGGMRQRFGIAQALLGSPKLLVIDEPTAGLDPLERNNFHNLLCEIGQNMVIVLSTHIVEDINNLCSTMAIMHSGEICFQGNPSTLIEGLTDKLWHKALENDELLTLQNAQAIDSIRLHNGKHHVRIVSDSKPYNGFAQIAPDLEDAYFYTLKQSISKREENHV